MHALLQAIEPARRELANHPLYAQVGSIDDLRQFMESHVFAVWDFMSLLKQLQRSITCVETPWLPAADANAARLINEIVLEEESDDCGELGYLSHFELYRRAMVQTGADCTAIDSFLALIATGEPVESALVLAGAPLSAQVFVGSTFRLLEASDVHGIAAAFAFGREDPIPHMFRRILAALNTDCADETQLLRLYLERHIALDEDHHTPLAVRMVVNLCGDEDTRWHEASTAARDALAARLDLWSGVHSELALVRAGVPLRLVS
ncbi:DUF3050 domain-containing protein [Sphingomonas sp. UV9]|uniref:DUF3050 domain-containing protein n=1 Tax=Sphingomonas sp. UV9 TaxID=1851410 RepID=UPI0019CF64CC|nr:DUF3050 domain-containing protein [Sphingomonas sp. UV9]